MTPKVAVLIKSRRRCCLCVHLKNDNNIKRGQIAHLNRNPNDNREENLAFLCFEHHDEYDCVTSQSKGITKNEIVHYRNLLYQQFEGVIFDKSTFDYSNDDEIVWIRFCCYEGHESWQQLWEFKAFHEWLSDRKDIEVGMSIWGVCPIHGYGIDGRIEEIKIREK